MPAGEQLIERVHAALDPKEGRTTAELVVELGKDPIRGPVAPRALRYALKALYEAGRARRVGHAKIGRKFFKQEPVANAAE